MVSIFLERRLRSGAAYYCSWCKRVHFKHGKKGKRHTKFKIEHPEKMIANPWDDE